MKPKAKNDPLSDGAEDLSAGVKRAMKVFDELGLKPTTADLIEGAKAILGSYSDPDIIGELVRIGSAIESISECFKETTNRLDRPYSGAPECRVIRTIDIGRG
jgi:hypothetical protein